MMLATKGVEVIPHICGPVEDVLRAYVSGHLTGQAFLMPGSYRRHGGGERSQKAWPRRVRAARKRTMKLVTFVRIDASVAARRVRGLT